MDRGERTGKAVKRNHRKLCVFCASIIENFVVVIIVISDWNEAFPSSLCEEKKSCKLGIGWDLWSASDEPQKIRLGMEVGLKISTTGHGVA